MEYHVPVVWALSDLLEVVVWDLHSPDSCSFVLLDIVVIHCMPVVLVPFDDQDWLVGVEQHTQCCLKEVEQGA